MLDGNVVRRLYIYFLFFIFIYTAVQQCVQQKGPEKKRKKKAALLPKNTEKGQGILSKSASNTHEGAVIQVGPLTAEARAT